MISQKQEAESRDTHDELLSASEGVRGYSSPEQQRLLHTSTGSGEDVHCVSRITFLAAQELENASVARESLLLCCRFSCRCGSS